ncbi:unnamed protein product, partial [Rotaria sp. Silwood1]
MHSDAPKSETTTTKSDCKDDINCTRLDCHFNHPNGRSIDHKMAFSSENTEGNTASAPHLECHNHQYQPSLASRTSSYNSSKSPSRTPNKRKQDAHVHTNVIELDCAFDHPNDEDINRVSSTDDTKTTSSSTVAKDQPLSDSEFIETTDKFLSTAEENLQEFDLNDDKYNNNDDEQVLDTKLERELKHRQPYLPIYTRRSDLIEKLKINQVLILKADASSGKSTQVVQYLCDANFADEKQIICTQPYKLAARSLAAQVAEEYGCKIGEEVCFQVTRGEPTTSSRAKIKFVTDTVFLNEYQNSPILEQCSVVIVDEAQERTIDTDIVLGLMKECLRKRKDLKLIVMFATLDTRLFYDYFASNFTCEILEVDGTTYPIEDIYLNVDDENYVQAAVTKAIEIHQNEEVGDILVFLTDQDEIDLALDALNKKLKNDSSFISLPLHEELSEEETAQLFEKLPDKRKIIFSTDIAESSITIDGIKYVIDSGMIKEKLWDGQRKIQVLNIGQITKNSVQRRRGTAGIISSGK